MDKPGVGVDQRDLPQGWHLKAVGIAAVALLVLYVVFVKILL